MRTKFDWYFSPSDSDIEHAWKNGVLTVDTNVLLDLYRYHQTTRDSLLQSLKTFDGTKWLSHQAATEFFRNRTKVIVSSEKTFKEAQDEIEKLTKSIDSAVGQLKGNRIIPSNIAIELDEQIKESTKKATDSIQSAREAYPRFLQSDPILETLANLFENSIGNDFEEKDRDGIRVIAEERKSKKIPPGYADDGKDDDRPYGDYYLWRQILDHSKLSNCPIIFVTSERKEDWWEIISGKTTGPRPELLREAKEYSGQKILIYKTERFLERSLARAKQPLNETAIEEIKAVSTWRSELEAAVRLLDHSVTETTQMSNIGTLHAELRRPVRNFTVSGHLDPHMEYAPQLEASLVSSPEPLPKHKISVGTGTTYDFNIHIICIESGANLPVGTYAFRYKAVCEEASAGEGKI